MRVVFPQAVSGNGNVSTCFVWKHACFHRLSVDTVMFPQLSVEMVMFPRTGCGNSHVSTLCVVHWKQSCFHGLSVETVNDMFPRAGRGNSHVSTGWAWKQSCFHGLSVETVMLPRTGCGNSLFPQPGYGETVMFPRACGHTHVSTGCVWKQ